MRFTRLYRMGLVAFVTLGAALSLFAVNQKLRRRATAASDIDAALRALATQTNAEKAADQIRFTEVASAAGIDFVYYGNPSPEHYMTEQNGGGIALLDFDGDDRLDLFFVNGSNFDRPAELPTDSNRLYRAGGRWRYDDVTESCGLAAGGFGMGCAAGDYDDDGFVDLFEAGYGASRLWHNNGDGTFDDVSDAAGIHSAQWATGAAFADLDGDGDLDLYVVNYVDFSRDDPPCFRPTERGPVRVLCDPFGKTAQQDLLFCNLGDGRFEEISQQAGIARDDGKGLAVAAADLDGDGRLDLYVANDTTPNFLFHNQGQMRFEEVASLRGAAVSADGRAQASMGIGCADYNGDGRLDLYVVNFENEVNDLYQNLGEAGFRSVNGELGLDPLSRSALGFGVAFSDFDLDHWPDLFVANGHIWDLAPGTPQSNGPMRPLLARNLAGRRFVDARQAAGEYFQQRHLGRAVAVGDLDNDGDADLVVSHLQERAALLRNDSRQTGGSMRLRLIGTTDARQPLGASVRLRLKGNDSTYWIPAGGSFQASGDPRVLIPVDDSRTVDEIVVRWPSGGAEQWRNVPVQPSAVFVQGSGERLR